MMDDFNRGEPRLLDAGGQEITEGNAWFIDGSGLSYNTARIVVLHRDGDHIVYRLFADFKNRKTKCPRKLLMIK